MNALIKSCYLWLALALSLIPAAHALEVNDPEHGFRFSLPDDFVREPNPKNPGNLHVYKRAPKEPGQTATVVEVKALDGPIAVGERVNTSKLEVDPSFNVGFDQIEWQTHLLDMVILTPKDPAMSHVAAYTTVFPISEQAIRFRVTGASAGTDPARAFFDKSVAGFSNTKPLQMAREQSAGYKLGGLVFKIVFWGLVALVFIRMIIRVAGGKKKGPRQPPPQAGPPGIRRPH